MAEGNNPTKEQAKEKTGAHHTRIDSAAFSNISKQMNVKNDDRLVVVRYFLDRPGYGLDNSAARLWFHPPLKCKPVHVADFLEKQGIALPGLLVEVFLDKYESFMLLEACEHGCIEWDFSEATYHNPGKLNIRLTDLSQAEAESNMTETDKMYPQLAKPKEPAGPQYANPTPAGLFSFSMMVGLETAALLGQLVPGTVEPAFAIAHGPYMIFVGGVMQLLVASFNCLRGNLYGATAFFGFGNFWFANGVTLVLRNHFSGPDTEAGDLIYNPDPWGLFFRSLFVFAFSAALLKQTLVMSRLSTTLIGLLCLKVGAAAFTGWTEVMQWIQLVFGTITSLFAFYVFMVEFTNGMYHREVFKPYKWSVEHSPEEVFGAAGKSGTLFSKAVRLRQAKMPDVHSVRGAMDANEREVSRKRIESQRAELRASQRRLPPTQEEYSKEFESKEITG